MCSACSVSALLYACLQAGAERFGEVDHIRGCRADTSRPRLSPELQQEPRLCTAPLTLVLQLLYLPYIYFSPFPTPGCSSVIRHHPVFTVWILLFLLFLVYLIATF